MSNGDKQFLKLRYNKWSVVVEIPKALREAFGVSRFIQSLGTDSLAQANVLKWPYVTSFKKAIDLAKKGHWEQAKAVASTAKGEEDLRNPEAYKKQLKALPDIPESTPERHARDTEEAIAHDSFMNSLSDMAEELERTEGLEAAKEFYAIASGKATPTMAYVDQWLAEKTLKEKTKDDYKTMLTNMSKTIKTLEQVDRKTAGAYQSKLLTDGGSVRRAKATFSAIRGYWDWLRKKGYLDENKANPWKDHEWPKIKKNKRKPFSDGNLVSIFETLAKKGECVDFDLCRIAVFTGLRLDEICSIKVVDVSEKSFTVPEAKTEAGVREVPIHSMLKPVFKRLIQDSQDGYILSNLSRNKYGDRSNAIGKRVNNFLTGLGFTERTQKFHSFRATLAKKFKEAQVKEEIAADIVGHELGTMTYGYYAGQVDIDVKIDAIEMLKYPEAMLKHF